MNLSQIKAWSSTLRLKSVHIWSYSGPHFPAFELNTERYSASLRIQSKCGKMQTRVTPNMDTFHVVLLKLEACNFISNNLILNCKTKTFLIASLQFY